MRDPKPPTNEATPTTDVLAIAFVEIERLSSLIDRMLAHCGNAECMECGAIVCPHGEPLHFHHDGCPACDYTDEYHPTNVALRAIRSAQSTERESADLAQRLAEAVVREDKAREEIAELTASKEVLYGQLVHSRSVVETRIQERDAALATVEQLRAERDEAHKKLAMCGVEARKTDSELAQLREELARVRSVIEDVIGSCDYDVPNFPRKRIKEACLAALKQPAGGQP